MMDHALNTKRKKHIAGGILLSVAFMLGGLAITVLTLKNEQEEKENNDESIYLE